MATPPGIGGVAIVRISGAEAFPILRKLVRHPGASTKLLISRSASNNKINSENSIPGINPTGGSRFNGSDNCSSIGDCKSDYDENQIKWETHRLNFVEVIEQTGSFDNNPQVTVIDQALAVIMRAPHSYTSEDCAEIHCHGGRVIPQLIVDLAIKHGARLAHPGEFTLRAYLNGKLDLMQAESVLGLIDAGSRSEVVLSAQGLQGELSLRVAAIRNRLLDIVAQLEAELDFGDEIPSLEASALEQSGLEVLNQIKLLLLNAHEGQALIEGPLAVLVGPPNAGKSTLYNLLVGQDKALVTPFAGTTRDQLESLIVINGLSIRLMDTAGLRVSADPVECMGVAKTKSSAAIADIIIMVLDSALALSDDFLTEIKSLITEFKGSHLLVVLNKQDLSPTLVSSSQIEALLTLLKLEHAQVKFKIVEASLSLGEADPLAGLAAITQHLGSLALGLASSESGGACSVNQRQRQALLLSEHSMQSMLEAVACDMPHDCLLLDLHQALKALGEVTGQDVSEDILDRVFSKFCLGK